MKLKWWHIGFALALFLAILSPLASPAPDGLEKVAEDKGFIGRAREAVFELIPDYMFPGIGNEAVATIIAGVVGTIILFAIGYGLAWLLRSKSRSEV